MWITYNFSERHYGCKQESEWDRNGSGMEEKLRRGAVVERIAVLMTFASWAAICSAQYRVLPGKADSDGCFPQTPARICLGATGTAHCYAASGDKDYIFGLEPKAMAVGQLDGGQLTLFTATFSGCGSGTLTNLALLTVKSGAFVNLLPEVHLTNQSEYKIWRLPQISSLPILATADFIWDFKAKETHFAAHRYHIEAFVYETKGRRYLRKISYDTTKKRPGLDEVDEIKVLDAEKQEMVSKLKQALHR
jgi:hypothetical protein